MQINDLGRAYAEDRDAIETAVVAALRSGRWLFGEQVAEFTRRFAAVIGAAEVVAVGNGTDALEIALRALGVGPGAEVVTTANAGGYATTAIRLVGATPVYCDVELPAMAPRLDDLLGLMDSRVAAVVVTHLYGNVADVAALQRALAAIGRAVPIVEDCAQAHGARRGGAAAGSLGDAATFSFYPTKNLGALGDAGAIATSRPEIAAAARALAQYGWSTKYRCEAAGGRNSRMDEVQAAILNVRLASLAGANGRRRAILARYGAVLPAPYRLCVSDLEETAAHLAVMLAPDRPAAIRHLRDRGIPTDIHYPVLDCDQPAWRALPMRCGELRNSAEAVAQVLTLPCFPAMTEAEITAVAGALADLPVP